MDEKTERMIPGSVFPQLLQGSLSAGVIGDVVSAGFCADRYYRLGVISHDGQGSAAWDRSTGMGTGPDTWQPPHRRYPQSRGKGALIGLSCEGWSIRLRR